MKDNIAKVGNVLKSEFLSQTSENMIDSNYASPQTQNTKNILQTLTPSELFWYERLTVLQPFQLPFETAGEQAEPRWAMSLWQSPLPKHGEEDSLRTLLQAFVIYLARLTQQTEFQIGWCVDEVKGKSANLAPVVPMIIEVAFGKPWGGDSWTGLMTSLPCWRGTGHLVVISSPVLLHCRLFRRWQPAGRGR
ncbi:hypothetical protein [Photorhabdus temperata]|uniref:hypothetical protein n=1 Tax=Photorhabdus temperata TaxID=574560 RepID=UPI00041725D1|nr:hypothetical protein [Photorhabdus temperata]